MGVSEYPSDGGLSFSGDKVLCSVDSEAKALGGKDGNDLWRSIVLLEDCCWRECFCRVDPCFAVFFLLRCIKES